MMEGLQSHLAFSACGVRRARIQVGDGDLPHGVTRQVHFPNLVDYPVGIPPMSGASN